MRVVFGPGTVELAASEALALGDRVLLIAGRHERLAAERVRADLGAHLAAAIDEVAQHVPVEVVGPVVRTAGAARAGVLLSIGGGSATGLAKAVARETGLPIVAVPTTYSGSEMTAIWGQSDDSGKTTGRDVRVLPRTVMYDPELTRSMPAGLTAASGMNALAHAVESLYAPDVTELSLMVAEEGIRSLAGSLPRAVADPNDPAGRFDALRGAWLAGWALGSTTMGLHHKLAHVLGGTYRLPHAGVHSALLAQVARFNSAAAPAAFSRSARALGVPTPSDVAPALFDLVDRVGAPTSLAELRAAAGGDSRRRRGGRGCRRDEPAGCHARRTGGAAGPGVPRHTALTRYSWSLSGLAERCAGEPRKLAP